MDPGKSFLLTDRYQLAMMQGCLVAGETGTAVFEFFVRKLPENRRFLVAADLAQVLETLRVPDEELAWLRASGHVGDDLIDYQRDFRFTGDVHAMPDGTVFFPNEPIIRVAAPLPEAQYVETRLINILHFQTLIASKTARMVMAAKGRAVVLSPDPLRPTPHTCGRHAFFGTDNTVVHLARREYDRRKVL